MIEKTPSEDARQTSVPQDANAKSAAASKSVKKDTEKTETFRKDDQKETSVKPDDRKAKSAPSHDTVSTTKRSLWLPFVLLVLVLGLAGGLWYQHMTSTAMLAQLETQNQASAQLAQQAEMQARQAITRLGQNETKINELIAELRSSRAELDGLNEAFQMITDRGSDLVLINDIDHLVTIAQQQLQLGGNVANAIISLETAQAQLARANRPSLASLQQTINGDLDRLRAATTVDVALLSSRLDVLSGLIMQAPLLAPDDVSPASIFDDADSVSVPDQAGQSDVARPIINPDDPWWQRGLEQTQHWLIGAFSALRNDLAQFVSVRRVDDVTALLVSSDQAVRFRNNLRLRVMTAQLALMMGQPQIWDSETAALLKAIESRYDLQSAQTRQALRIARDIADTSIDTALPTVTNSIKALEALREQESRDSLRHSSDTVTSDSAESGNAVRAGHDAGAAADDRAEKTVDMQDVQNEATVPAVDDASASEAVQQPETQD